MKRTRYTLDEATAGGRKRSRKLIPEFTRDFQPGCQGIAPIFNGLFRCGAIRSTARKVGKNNSVSASFLFREGVNLKRVLDCRSFHSATPSSTNRTNFFFQALDPPIARVGLHLIEDLRGQGHIDMILQVTLYYNAQ